MARSDIRTASKRRPHPEGLPFTSTNYRIIGLGLVSIILGYIALAQSPWDGTMPLVVAPILLVAGYCVIIPFGIMYRKRTEKPDVAEDSNKVVETPTT